MGILGMGSKKTCSFCNGNAGIGSIKCIDGVICNKCFKGMYNDITGLAQRMTIEEIKGQLASKNKNKQQYENFNITKKIDKHFVIDEEKGLWYVPNKLLSKKIPNIYSFKDIISFELIEDNESIVKGGLGRALVGGALLGGVGAVVGGATGSKTSKKVITKLIVKITINDMNNPVVMINLIEVPTKSSSIIYKTKFKAAQEILSVLAIIVKNNDNLPEENSIGDFKFCTKCGTKLQADAAFCSGCGEKL